MKFRKSALLTLALAALALAGCDQKVSTDSPAGDHAGQVGTVSASLTLPDDSEITSVDFSITGPGGYLRTGSVPVLHSTILTFRIGELPLGVGYVITLSATTSFGNECMGSSLPFDIVSEDVTGVVVTLSCDATDGVGDIVVNGEFESCPIVTAITALPAEVEVGFSVSLEAAISHGDTPVAWTAPAGSGSFATPAAYATTFTCNTPGDYVLTVAVNGAAVSTPECTDAQTVDITCTLGAGCGNGAADPGEECDDGNTVDTDGCTNSCNLPACGDGILQAGEECDDSNTVNGDLCSATCLDIECGNSRVDPGESCDDGNMVNTDACPNSCSAPGCGDGIQQAGEECDDGNMVNTDMCSNLCDLNACGDGEVDPGEQCDDGNAVDTDACRNNCTTVSSCDMCRASRCVSYVGTNPVAGCFDATATGDAVRTAYGSTLTPTQVQYCVDAMACAFTNNCGHNTANIATPCYCGGISVDACNMSGPQLTGAAWNPVTRTGASPCYSQWQNMAGGASVAFQDVLLRMADTTYATGWAYSLLECEASRCDDSSFGDCTND